MVSASLTAFSSMPWMLVLKCSKLSSGLMRIDRVLSILPVAHLSYTDLADTRPAPVRCFHVNGIECEIGHWVSLEVTRWSSTV